MQSVKETASNIAASAKAGMEKTKAVVQEKVEKMSAHDHVQKEMATENKEERIAHAELHKQEAREHNAAAKQVATAGGRPEYTTGGSYETHTRSATSVPGYPMGAHQMSSMPAHGTGHPEEGVAGLPLETTTGYNNIHVERNTRTGPGLGDRADEPGYNGPGY